MSLLESEKTEVVSQSSIESVDVNENNIGKSDKAKVDSTPKKQKVKGAGVPVLRKPRYLWRPEHEYVLRSALQSFKFLPRTTTYKVVGSNILVA